MSCEKNKQSRSRLATNESSLPSRVTTETFRSAACAGIDPKKESVFVHQARAGELFCTAAAPFLPPPSRRPRRPQQQLIK